MKSKTHHMVEAMTAALGPIFHANPDYKTISEAVALVMARVAQSTPNKGDEILELEIITDLAHKALIQFLDEEEAIQEQRSKVLQKGIEAFAEMVPQNGADGPRFGLAAINGGMSPEARDEAEEFAGQAHGEASWENSPLHEEIARFEQDHPNVGPDGDPGYHPDGPRAYL